MGALPTTLIPENKIDRHLGQGGRDSEVYGVFIYFWCGENGSKISRGCRAYRSFFSSEFVETSSIKPPNHPRPRPPWGPRKCQDLETIRQTLLYSPLSSIPKELALSPRR